MNIKLFFCGFLFLVPLIMTLILASAIPPEMMQNRPPPTKEQMWAGMVVWAAGLIGMLVISFSFIARK